MFSIDFARHEWDVDFFFVRFLDNEQFETVRAVLINILSADISRLGDVCIV